MKSNLTDLLHSTRVTVLRVVNLSQPGSDKKDTFHFAELFGGAGIATATQTYML